MSEAAQYLIDTGWAIRYLRGRKPYVDKLVSLGIEHLAISAISVAELYEGVALAKEREKAEGKLRDFLAGMKMLTLDEDTCRAFGDLSADLRRRGLHPGDFDVMIAATARQHGLTVLTTDADDFNRISGLTVISEP